MYLIRPPKLYRWLFKDAVFRKNTEQKTIYLTFDDGPHPEATPYVLSVLNTHGIKATFFVLGKNVKKHPELFNQLKEEGHQIGNHGMNHPNGWRTSTDDYITDVMLGKAVTGSSLFRPPYGKLTLPQYNRLKETEEIVFWDVISGDFDQKIDASIVVKNVLNNVRDGSVIVMHDSKKAMSNISDSMNEIITSLKEKGYNFAVLETSDEPQY